MEVQFWGTSDVGRSRDHNEDNFLVDGSLGLFVVCDGMGGHAAGEFASAIAAKTIRNVLKSHEVELESELKAPNEAGVRERILGLFASAVEKANRRVIDAADDADIDGGMGTTCCALMLRAGRGYVAHVGDSRMYRIRNRTAEQITDDHSLRNRMIEEGRLGENEEFDRENAVIRAVGMDEDLEVETFTIEVMPGDQVLLCSDGFSDYLEGPEQLPKLLAPDAFDEAVQNCIDYANEAGGKDNVTVVLAEADQGEGVWETTEPRDDIRLLRRLPPFDGLSARALTTIADAFEPQSVPSGTLLARPGEPVEAFTVIAEGSAEVVRDGAAVERLAPGDTWGERALFGAPLSDLVVRSDGPLDVLRLERADFHELLDSDDELAARLSWRFGRRFAEKLGKLPFRAYRRPDELGEQPTPRPEPTESTGREDDTDDVQEEVPTGRLGDEPTATNIESDAPSSSPGETQPPGAAEDSNPPPIPGGGEPPSAAASESPAVGSSDGDGLSASRDDQPTDRGSAGGATSPSDGGAGDDEMSREEDHRSTISISEDELDEFMQERSEDSGSGEAGEGETGGEGGSPRSVQSGATVVGDDESDGSSS
ncbi:MAG: protein phosphatase 2C domain-containing protein [Bradymonadaceae bacterium]